MGWEKKTNLPRTGVLLCCLELRGALHLYQGFSCARYRLLPVLSRNLAVKWLPAVVKIVSPASRRQSLLDLLVVPATTRGAAAAVATRLLLLMIVVRVVLLNQVVRARAASTIGREPAWAAVVAVVAAVVVVVVEVGVLVVLVELLTPSQSWVALCYRTKNTLASTAGNRKGVHVHFSIKGPQRNTKNQSLHQWLEYIKSDINDKSMFDNYLFWIRTEFELWSILNADLCSRLLVSNSVKLDLDE